MPDSLDLTVAWSNRHEGSILNFHCFMKFYQTGAMHARETACLCSDRNNRLCKVESFFSLQIPLQ